MSGGKGFARRVTRDNLNAFAPLLGKKRASERASQGELPDDASNGATNVDPELAAAEAIFQGTPFATGMRYSFPARLGAARGRGVREQIGDVASDIAPVGREELLMRIRPRRDGTQVQFSMVVHESKFMSGVMELTAASDGTKRPLGFDLVGERKNNLRFEAPELAGMRQPVARFRWVSPGEGHARVLRYEVFDAEESAEGRKILAVLKSGIGKPPNTKLSQIGQSETVLSKRNLENSQWYRLQPVKSKRKGARDNS